MDVDHRRSTAFMAMTTLEARSQGRYSRVAYRARVAVARVGGARPIPRSRTRLRQHATAPRRAFQNVAFIGIGLSFLIAAENRVQRRRAFAFIRELRAIAHIVDMHQLTKDPERVLSPGMTTPSSPKPGLTRFELGRYLDYCSELLSLTSKLAALHVQCVNDPVVLDAVNDIETLGSDLSSKIWQKIMILDMSRGGED
jgi:hypothetical protein